MSKALLTETLHFQEGGSDKVYIPSVVHNANGGFDVIAGYGRRGAALQFTKKATGVDEAKARKAYEKLIAGKLGKGYRPVGGAASTVALVAERDGRRSGIPIQLLNPVNSTEFQDLLDDPGFYIQEKMDGDRRLLVIGNDGDVAGVNRKGLFVPLPQSIVETAKTLPHDSIVDGELIGETLYAFDAQRVGGEDLTSCGFAQRFVALRAALNSVATNIRVVPCVEGSERRTFAQQLRDRGAEGVVVRNSHAPYTPGRPSSGGSARKFKHYATASVVTIAHNDRHSIVMGVYDGRGTLCDVGSVTIPPSKALPSIGAVLEVRYLYAFPLPGGCLYQPTFLAVRDDIDSSECGVEQLIFKADVAA